jgi:transposase
LGLEADTILRAQAGRAQAAKIRKHDMAQPLLPMFPSDVTEINELVSFAKRDGTVYYFNGPMPVFSHPETDRASFRMFPSQLVVNDNCTQAQIVRAFGISAISMKRYVKQYRQSGAAGFFKGRAARQPRVLTPGVLQKAQELMQQGRGRNPVAQELGIKSDTLRKAIQAGRIVAPIKKK